MPSKWLQYISKDGGQTEGARLRSSPGDRHHTMEQADWRVTDLLAPARHPAHSWLGLPTPLAIVPHACTNTHQSASRADTKCV